MVMATALTDRITPVDFNHLNLKKTTPGFLDHHHNGELVSKAMIGGALRHRVESIDPEFCDAGDEDTFFVADLGHVYRQHLRWKKNLPRVKPFYAVKCNPDPKVLRLLAELGNGFDCASKTEIKQVLDMGVDPSRIIYAQPCKTNSYVRYVAAEGVRQMTFDNADELYKIAKLFPEAELYLRILTDDSSSLCRLSLKFGASLDATDGLLALARELGLNVVGVSFHVGSGASDPLAFLKAVRDANFVFEQAAAHGFDMKTLDVGGGFCSDDTFEAMAGVLRDALDEYFPPHRGVSLIAEPGRYFVSAAFTIACNVIARRTVEDPNGSVNGSLAAAPSYMVYVNDGLYGNFSSIMFDHQHPVAKVLRSSGNFFYNTTDADSPESPSEGIEYSIWGPTCDGIDRISESVRFSQTIDVGDWLYFEDMGAYTKCSATRFNGFSDAHDVIYVCSEPAARAMMLNYI
ncbi:ornithine decarboxylase [Pyricularia oryzae 70-15]|uniref:Ornithine decarboxylase n=2 Tax=Pyricularia oryzae TaxID=318829 RepID=G4MRJ1_PYRO7|nr:ornithine decarboxylase [Pyricularia oryzae 70-15]EHA56618.1 ornithine decarboxylase [Pyricularia oryzae 70-15]ELQ38488.1 ornithine decarboxylase [Pyricularia oryzae Y34]KAI7915937.1 ornithine decarboxylase [Pyricularia oryzae]KAI7930282.1 ornithine decarboxylase [Pyricularia oryzae]